MSFIEQYWTQLAAFVMAVITVTRIQSDVEVLKEKVKVAFDLINKLREELYARER
jgi:hypothetical protein